MDFFNERDDSFGDDDDLFDDDLHNSPNHGSGADGKRTAAEEEQAILDEKYEPSKEATLLLVDADLEYEKVLHEEVILSLESFVRHKIIASKEDKIALVKYNTDRQKNYCNFPAIYTVADFTEPGSALVQKLRSEKEKGITEENRRRRRRKPTRKSSTGAAGITEKVTTLTTGAGITGTGTNDEEKDGEGGAVMSEVFWNCMSLFKLQIGETVTYKRRVMIFASNDDPIGMRGTDDANELKALEESLDVCLTRVRDCKDAGLEFEFYPVVKANAKFSLNQFWNKVAPLENIESEQEVLALTRLDDSALLPEGGGSGEEPDEPSGLIVDADSQGRNFKSLETRIRKRLFKKRALTRTVLYLAPDVSLSVSVYINILEAKLPPPVWLHSKDLQRVVGQQKLVEEAPPAEQLALDVGGDAQSGILDGAFAVGSVTKNAATGWTDFGLSSNAANGSGSASGAAAVVQRAGGGAGVAGPAGSFGGAAAASSSGGLGGAAPGPPPPPTPGTHYSMGDKPELSSFVQIAGEEIPFTDEEVKKLRNFGDEPCMELIGFMPQSKLKPYHHYTHSYLVYPNEKKVIGSTILFKSLLTSMRNRKVMMLVWFRARANAEPRLTALLPSPGAVGTGLNLANAGVAASGNGGGAGASSSTGVDGAGAASSSAAPPPNAATYPDANLMNPVAAQILSKPSDVMSMIPLPHFEDFRKETSHPVVDTKNEPAVDAPKTCEAFKILLDNIALDSFHVTDVANAAIQKHYSALQALALNEQKVEEVVDELQLLTPLMQPDADAFSNGNIVQLINMVNESKPAGELLAIADGIGGNYGSTSELYGALAGGAAAAGAPAPKKRKVAASSSGEETMTVELMAAAIQQNQVNQLKVTALKAFLKSVALRVDGKKADLVERVKMYMQGRSG
eukprot:g7476.t1